jgi:Tn3 transposase DDE domain
MSLTQRHWLGEAWLDPRQNSLALALEIGRIERRLFTLAWIEDPWLRCRVTAGLHKGEARNSLARDVFFNRLEEIRARSFENQRLPSQWAQFRCYCDHALEYGLSRTGRRGAGKISGCRSRPVSERLPLGGENSLGSAHGLSRLVDDYRNVEDKAFHVALGSPKSLLMDEVLENCFPGRCAGALRSALVASHRTVFSIPMIRARCIRQTSALSGAA